MGSIAPVDFQSVCDGYRCPSRFSMCAMGNIAPVDFQCVCDGYRCPSRRLAVACSRMSIHYLLKCV